MPSPPLFVSRSLVISAPMASSVVWLSTPQMISRAVESLSSAQSITAAGNPLSAARRRWIVVPSASA
jgi:hypothetical protein